MPAVVNDTAVVTLSLAQLTVCYDRLSSMNRTLHQ
jgi:hypothetical protein